MNAPRSTSRPTEHGVVFIHEVVPGTGGGCNSTIFTLQLVQ